MCGLCITHRFFIGRVARWAGRTIPPELLLAVEAKLRTDQWSPEQISGTFRKQGIGNVSHESIYQYIYRDKRAGGKLHTHLRHRCKSYRKRGLGRERRGRIKDQVMIDERPAIVEERSRVGDWEMDTVIGSLGGSVLVTMVERKSRYTVIALVDSKESADVPQGMLHSMRPCRDKVETMTFDNGKEFARHGRISRFFGKRSEFGELAGKLSRLRSSHQSRKILCLLDPVTVAQIAPLRSGKVMNQALRVVAFVTPVKFGANLLGGTHAAPNTETEFAQVWRRY